MLMIFKKRKLFSIKTQLYKMLSLLLGIIILHTMLMIYFENLSFMDALWLTMTSATTVGYGDYSAQTTEGRWATILLLYIIGIAALARSASMYFEYRHEVRDKILTGKWYWKMKDHIVFLNCSEETGERYFYEAISGFRASNADIAEVPIIIVSAHFRNGLSDKLQKLNVVLVNQEVTSDECFDASNINKAHTVVIFSQNSAEVISDSINFELVDRLRSMGVRSRIIVEVVSDKNRCRLKKAGADNTLRPIRAYPELLMRAILAPGSEQVIETLFNSSDGECIKYNIKCNLQWLEVINIFTTNDIGMPVAYENESGDIINNPSITNIVNSVAVFVFVRTENIHDESQVGLLFSSQS
jgi:voltage-gated potassium channel